MDWAGLLSAWLMFFWSAGSAEIKTHWAGTQVHLRQSAYVDTADDLSSSHRNKTRLMACHSLIYTAGPGINSTNTE